MIRRLLVPLLAAAALVPAAPALAQTALDTQAPRLVSFDFTPKTVNSATGDTEVIVTARWTDATGLKDTAPELAVFNSTTSSQSAGAFSYRIAGTQQDATYRGTATIRRGAAPGPWSASLFGAEDALGNTVGYESLVDPQILTVTNTVTTPPPVVTPPVVPPPPTAPVTPAPVPVSPTITANARVVTLGQSSTVTVEGAAGASVRLYAYTRPNTIYRLVRTGTLNRSGDFGRISFPISPRGNTRLYAVVGGRQTATTTVNVAQAVSIRASSTAGPTYVFSGQVSPARGSVFVDIYRSHFKGATLVSRTVTGSDGSYSVTRRFTGTGTFSFWAVARYTADNAEGISSRIGVAVRPYVAPRGRVP